MLCSIQPLHWCYEPLRYKQFHLVIYGVWSSSVPGSALIKASMYEYYPADHSLLETLSGDLHTGDKYAESHQGLGEQKGLETEQGCL